MRIERRIAGRGLAPRAALLVLGLLPGIACQAQSHPLFADDTTLQLEMALDFDDLCRDPENEACEDGRGIMHYTGPDGGRRSLEIRFRTRGRWRKITGDCAFPALFLYLDEEEAEGTLFEGQSMLPFTSHCQHYHRQYHSYTLLEYLAYRYYNLLTEDSLRVRLAHITYRDTGSRRKYSRYGFFSEHFEHMAERIGAEWFETDRLDPRETDATELATLSVFQYMIGNLDWSVVIPHNITLLRRKDGTVVAVPFDFDYAGIVDAEYAAPPEFLRLRSVRSRKYRGFCRPEIDWDGIFGKFMEIRPEVMRLAQELKGLSRGASRRTTYFLGLFYDTIESDRKRRDRIVEGCRPLPAPWG